MSLAQAMFQAASQNIRDTKSDPSAIAKSFATGMQLAQRKQQLAQQQEQNQQLQQQAKAKGVEKVLEVYRQADKYKNEADARRHIKFAVPGLVEAYGVNDVFTPEVQEMMNGSREARQAAFMIESQVRSGQMSAAEGMQALNMSGLAEYAQQARLAEAEKFAMSEGGKDRRVERQAQIQDALARSRSERIGREALDRTAGKAAAEYAQGGSAVVQTNINRMEGAIQLLQGPEEISNSIRSAVPFIGSDAVTDLVNKEMARVRDDIRGAIQGTLRETMGSQFTEKEAQALFDRAYNPRLSDEENARRAGLVLNELKTIAANKDQAMQYFAQNNTMRGFVPQRQREGDSFVPPQEKVDQLVRGVEAHLRANKSPEDIFRAIKSSNPNVSDDVIRQYIRKAQDNLGQGNF